MVIILTSPSSPSSSSSPSKMPWLGLITIICWENIFKWFSMDGYPGKQVVKNVKIWNQSLLCANVVKINVGKIGINHRQILVKNVHGAPSWVAPWVAPEQTYMWVQKSGFLYLVLSLECSCAMLGAANNPSSSLILEDLLGQKRKQKHWWDGRGQQ